MKDRYLPLSPRLLVQLRAYWRRYRPPLWLFPGHPKDRPLSRHGAGWIYDAAKTKAGITKEGGIHTLRHYAASRFMPNARYRAGGALAW